MESSTLIFPSQAAKYSAKFILLEHGLLDAAQGVDDIKLRVKKVPKDKNKMDVDDEEEDQRPVKEVASDETAEQFILRINYYVQIHLLREKESKRGHYKNELVYKTRKDVIQEFLKAILLKTCQNSECGW